MTTQVLELPSGALLATLNKQKQTFVVNGIDIQVNDISFMGLSATAISRRSSLGKLTGLEVYPKDGLNISLTNDEGFGIRIRRVD